MSCSVKTFRDDPLLLEQFLALPAWMRERDAHGGGASDTERWQLSAANPFFRYGVAQHFIAFEGERPVARCSAMVNSRLTQDGVAVGLVGFFESFEAQEPAQAVLQAAITWLGEQGVGPIWGPVQFSIWHGYRLMTRGFERPPFVGEPRNPSYYPRLFTRCGFRPLSTWRSWDLSRSQLQQIVDSARAAPVATLEGTGFRAVPFDVEHFTASLRTLHGLMNEGFTRNLGFSVIDFDEFEALFSPMKPLIVPELVVTVYDEKNQALGFAYAYPDPRAGVVLHTMVLRPEARGKGAVGPFFIDTVVGAALQRGGETTIGALAKAGRTFYDKTGEATREYTLYEFS